MLKAKRETKTYDDEAAFEKDRQFREWNDWRLVEVTRGGETVRIGRTLAGALATGGIGLLIGGRAKRAGRIIAIWEHDR